MENKDIEFQNQFYITMKMIEIQNEKIMQSIDKSHQDIIDDYTLQLIEKNIII